MRHLSELLTSVVNSRSLRMSAAVAAFVVLLVFQLQGVSSIGPESPGGQSGNSLPATAILTMRTDRQISLNGALATSGATILSGATIATSPQAMASVHLGLQGSVLIAPDTTLTVTFSNDASLRAILMKGCASLHARKGTVGEIETAQGVVQKTDPNTGGIVRSCFPQGTHLAAEAVTDQSGVDGLFGLGKAAALGIIGGRMAKTEGVSPVGRGMNPGPSAP
ncbi:MAG: hypothetical protein AABN95_11075 [Acidobacteriota bacterium]